jgi:hypothetical protein
MPKDPDGADGIEGVAAAGGSDTEDDMIAGTKKPDPVRGTPVAAPMGAVQGHGGKAADAPLTKAKCAKCMKVHKDGVEACQKDDLAAAQKDGMEASAKSVPAPYPTSNPNCPCCDGSSPTKCTGSDGCCALCRNQSECQMALAVLPNALPASPTVKPTKATDADLRKRRAAVRALVTKYLWGGEENDIADAAAILGRLRDLYASESAEDDEGSAQLELLATAFAAIQRFASLESDELGDDPTADAQGAPPDTSAVPESKDAGGMALALDPKFTKALMPRVLNAYARKIAQSYAPATTPELFKVNHGDQLAEGIGKGLSETHALIAKAQAETRGFVEAGFKGLGETIGKLAKTAAVPMPLRTVPAAAGTGGTSTAAVAQLEAAGNGISDPELRAKWNQALNIAKAIG